MLAIVRARRRADIVQGLDELVGILAHKTKTQVEYSVRIGGADKGEPSGGCRPSFVNAKGLPETEGKERSSEQKASC